VSGGPRLVPLGEAATLVRWPARVPSRGLALRVRAARDAVAAAGVAGLVDLVPGPGSLLVRFDPARTSRGGVNTRI